MSPTGEGGYPHGSVGEEAALLAAAIEEWVRSAKETFGPLVTTALGAAAARAAGFASGAAAAGAAAAARGPSHAGGPGTPRAGAASGGTGPGGGAASAGPGSAGTASGGTASGGTGEAHSADESSDGTDWATDGLFGHLYAAAEAAQPGGAAECRYCPLCRMLAALRGPRPEVMEYLVEAATLLLAALRSAIEAHERSWVSGPPVPVEHIDIL